MTNIASKARCEFRFNETSRIPTGQPIAVATMPTKKDQIIVRSTISIEDGDETDEISLLTETKNSDRIAGYTTTTKTIPKPIKVKKLFFLIASFLLPEWRNQL